jgi:hypothetical protein
MTPLANTFKEPISDLIYDTDDYREAISVIGLVKNIIFDNVYMPVGTAILHRLHLSNTNDE